MKDSSKRIKPDLSVSETVGFIIIFGITITGIAIVTLYGYPALLNAQADANIRNMERNMIVLQSDVNALVYKSVPYKETTMQVSGGVLSIEKPDPSSSESPYFEIADGNNQLLTALPNQKFFPGTIHFLSDLGDVAVALENGAVVKWQIGETGRQYKPAVMLSKPRWFIDDSGGTQTMVITLIQIDSDRELSKSGISTVQMKIEPLLIHDPDGTPNSGDETNFFDNSPGGNKVKITATVKDKFFRAWGNYVFLDLIKKNVPDPLPSTWEIDNIDRLIIKGYKITVIGL